MYNLRKQELPETLIHSNSCSPGFQRENIENNAVKPAPTCLYVRVLIEEPSWFLQAYIFTMTNLRRIWLRVISPVHATIFGSVVARKNMRITIFLRWSLTFEWKLWVLAQSLMIAVSFHLSAFMTPQRFSLGCCLLNWDWLKQYESYIQHCTTEREICSFCCLSFSFAFIFWQAPGACYRFPKCISLHFCNLRWPLRYFAPRLYIHSHKKSFMLLI